MSDQTSDAPIAGEKRERRVFDDAFKAACVAAVKGGKSYAEVAKEMNTKTQNVANWVRAAGGGEKRAPNKKKREPKKLVRKRAAAAGAAPAKRTERRAPKNGDKKLGQVRDFLCEVTSAKYAFEKFGQELPADLLPRAVAMLGVAGVTTPEHLLTETVTLLENAVN